MTQSKDKITRTNAMNIIRRFAKEYRKAFGKALAEIMIFSAYLHHMQFTGENHCILGKVRRWHSQIFGSNI